VNIYDTISPLVERLRAPLPSARQSAAGELAALGNQAQAAVPALLTTLHDTSAGVRRATALALGKIRAPGAGVIAALIAALQHDENPAVQQAAAEALGEKRAEAIQALSALRLAMRDLHEGVRQAAAQSFRQIQQAIQAKDAA
jgi:HEAT repeat protein